MPARSTWRGSIEISGLSISVRAFNAVDRSPEIELHHYHKTCSSPVQLQRICPIHGPIDSDGVVDGFEHAKDCVLLLSSEESGSILPNDTKTINVQCFVSRDDFYQAYLSGKHYYVVPNGSTDQRPFVAIHEALGSANQIALAKVVLHRTEYLVGIKPVGRLLQMSVIEYSERVREATDYESEVEMVQISKEEKQLASELLQSMARPRLNLEDHRNPRTARLAALLDKRIQAIEGQSMSDRFNTEDESSIPVASSDTDSHSALLYALRNAIRSVTAKPNSIAEVAAIKGEVGGNRMTG
jgi:DNA end-binding protein Ku